MLDLNHCLRCQKAIVPSKYLHTHISNFHFISVHILMDLSVYENSEQGKNRQYSVSVSEVEQKYFQQNPKLPQIKPRVIK